MAQVNAHLVPSQVSVPLVGAAGQGVQEVVPQLFRLVLSAQAVPHLWKAPTQAKPQLVPSQVSIALAGADGHGLQELPRVLTLVLLAQLPLPQSWVPVLQV